MSGKGEKSKITPEGIEGSVQNSVSASSNP